MQKPAAVKSYYSKSKETESSFIFMKHTVKFLLSSAKFSEILNIKVYRSVKEGKK